MPNIIDKVNINGTAYNINEGVGTRLFRATCPTAGATAAKVATLDDATNFSLYNGIRVLVTFQYGNSADTPTLNVNNTGALTIAIPTDTGPTTGNGTTYNTWGNYESVIFTYDGTYWVNSGSGKSVSKAYSVANAYKGTVTSVQVQATSPVQSSTSTAQTSTLNTTISLADNYGDTKNPYASKTKNYVLAAPSNANGAPSFRALVAGDIPDLSGTYSTTDTKVSTAAAITNNTYYPTLGTNTTAATTKYYDPDGFSYYNLLGTSQSVGQGMVILGNNVASPTEGNKQGLLKLFGIGDKYVTISTSSTTALSENRSITIPDKTGTIALTSDLVDTKNTAGATDTSSKIFLIGATAQSANPQTYSHDTAYVGTNGHLYSGSKEVLVGGSNAASAVTISPTTTDVYSMTSAGSVTAGTANVPTVIDTTKFSGGSYSHTGFSGGSFTQGSDSFTANTPTVINTAKFSGGSFIRGTFTSGSLTMAIDGTDGKKLNITFTAPTHAADSFTAASLASGFYTAGTAASFTQGSDSFTAASYGTDSFTAAKFNSGFYTAGTANIPTAVTLPGRSSKIEAWTGYNTGVSNTYAAAQTFTGATS